MGKFIGVALLYACVIFGLFAAPQSLWSAYPLVGAAAATLGRIPQIRENYINEHTGTLSAFTFVLNSLGGVARMFTTLNETGDKFIAASQLVGVSVSIIILIQIIMYHAKTKDMMDERTKNK
jgi:mannose-P-dolichol utilization defect protein 1